MPNEKDEKPVKPTTTVKVESSTRSSGSIVRLPSFRQPRDLTLGSGSVGRGGALGLGVNKARKTYAPNLNVQRNKAKEEVKIKEESGRGRGERGRGRGERGRSERGRGRGAPNVIQLTSGVFSEGIGSGSARRAGRAKQEDSGSSYVPKPKLDLKKNYSSDSKEENERLRQLLQDDFVDDPDVVMDGIKPLQLPMIPMKKKGALKTGKPVVKKEKEDPDLKVESSVSESSEVKIKKEPGDDGAVDFKPMSEDEGHIVFERRVGDLLGSRESECILVQLPDCLPGLRPTVEPEGTKSVNGSTESGEEGSKIPQCTLSTIPEGCIGKIQLMRSGRAYLKLGSVSLPITMGTQVGFKQELISVQLNEHEKTGKMINLGQVKARVVMTPEWETLLGKA